MMRPDPAKAATEAEATVPETRARIMDAALELFSSKGYDGVSVRALAHAAGVNLAMISYYFGSKEALYHSVLENKVETTRLRILQVHDAAASPIQKIRDIIDIYVERVLDNVAFHRLMMRELARPEDSGIGKKLRDTLLKNMRMMTEIIEEGVAQKIFRPVDPTFTILSLISSVTIVAQHPTMAMRLFGAITVEQLYEPKFKERIKAHLNDMVLTHLLIQKH